MEKTQKRRVVSWRKPAAFCGIATTPHRRCSLLLRETRMIGLRPVPPVYCTVGFFVCLFFISSSSSSSPPPPTGQGSQGLVCNSKDRHALVGFSGGLDSGVPDWRQNASSNCCGWPGVKCGISSSPRNSSVASDSRVVGLELGGRGLKGAVDGKYLLRLDELRILNLSKNSLVGGIPAELFRLRQLEVLDLSRNNFAGVLSDGIGNLSGLKHLDISSNGFSGSIPDAFLGLGRLQHFSGRSNFFTGRLPASLSSRSMLTSLDLGDNSLSGNIGLALDFTRLLRLRTLRLDKNEFFGRIPKGLSSCRGLETLNLAQNKLHGHIPWGFKYLGALSSLSLSHNGFSHASRAFSIFQECRNLKVLGLAATFVGETMPADGIAGFEGLDALVLANCSLRGSIPRWLRSCPRLRLLDLSSNRLGGDVPPWLGNFTRLFYLDLSNNSLGGVIPHTMAHLKALNDARPVRPLATISFTDFPFSYAGKKSLNRVSLQVRFTRSTFFPPTLDLSHNAMNGTIPTELGNLFQTRVLNLSNNYFSGSIPPELSGMRLLESLDLSFNRLSGSIPRSLTLMGFLAEFSVAHNNLSGSVPSDAQFATFEYSSYEGNPSLCGPPVLVPCGCLSRPTAGGCPPVPTPPAPVDSRDTDEFRITFLPLPFGIGVAIGFIPTIVGGFYRRYRRRRKQRQD